MYVCESASTSSPFGRATLAWCVVMWCGVVWCGVMWCGVVWCGVVWCGVSRDLPQNFYSLRPRYSKYQKETTLAIGSKLCPQPGRPAAGSVMLCHVVSCCVMLCVVWCHVVSCCVMLCVVWCHVVSCGVM